MPFRHEKYGPWVAGIVLAMSFIILGLAILYTFRQQDHVDHKLCQQTIENRDATRKTWNAARMFIVRSQKGNEDAVANTNVFFDAILATIPRLECVNNRPTEVQRPK